MYRKTVIGAILKLLVVKWYWLQFTNVRYIFPNKIISEPNLSTFNKFVLIYYELALGHGKCGLLLLLLLLF